jgi:hypothetical protein
VKPDLAKMAVQDRFMRGKYLGDSYDLVKRFWSENLGGIAPLYAHPRFIPAQIHGLYEAVTLIPIFVPESAPKGSFGILLDPDTGIPLPKSSQRTTVSHATLHFIIQVIEEFRPKYVICFDQSCHRKHELSRAKQRQAKMEFLSDRGFASFYYVSHAPFLFITKTMGSLAAIRAHLMSRGIPGRLLESCAGNRHDHL